MLCEFLSSAAGAILKNGHGVVPCKILKAPEIK